MHNFIRTVLLTLLPLGFSPIQANTISVKTTQGQGLIIPLKTSQTQLINFWATWCGPCRQEIPEFNQLHKTLSKHKIKITGIALDTADNVAMFQQSLKLNYTNYLGTEKTLDTMRQLGNTSGALPFTVIIDRSGQVIYKKTGAIQAHEIKPYLTP